MRCSMIFETIRCCIGKLGKVRSIVGRWKIAPAMMAWHKTHLAFTYNVQEKYVTISEATYVTNR